MNYQRGMDLALWVDAHADMDVIVRLALVVGEFNEEGEWIAEPPDFTRLYEETGRLIGIVDGFLYLDHPADSTSMPIPQVIQMIREFTDKTDERPWGMVVTCVGATASPHPVDPALIAEIEVDHAGVGRQRADAQRVAHEEKTRHIDHIVSTEPCCLCGRMVQSGDGGYYVLAPDSGLGESGDPRYVPIGPT